MPKAVRAQIIDSDESAGEVVPKNKRPVKRKVSPTPKATAGLAKRAAVNATGSLARLQQENQRLQGILDQQIDLNRELFELRETEPEGMLERLREEGDERRAQFVKQNDLYKAEIAELKKQVRELEDERTRHLTASSESKSSSSSEVFRLRAEVDSLRKQLNLAEGQRAGPASTAAKVQELETTVALLERELEAETAQSKSLQSRLNDKPTIPSDEATRALELTNDLLTELTGLHITKVHPRPSEEVIVKYDCILTDTRPSHKPGQRLSLRFALKFDAENCLEFSPILDPKNDQRIMEQLAGVAVEWLTMIRFDRASSPTFFRKLMACVYQDSGRLKAVVKREL